MPRSIKPWFEIAAYTITITALLAIIALAVRLGSGLAIATSMFAAFFCVFVGIAAKRERIHREPARMSIKEELDLRKLRARGTGIRLR